MSVDFLEECLSELERTPATLNALLRNLPMTFTAANEGPNI
jgi:hypothetical protein